MEKYFIGYIYRLSDIKNNVWYVGWTNHIFRRLKEHWFRFYNENDWEFNKFFYIECRKNSLDMLKDINYEI